MSRVFDEMVEAGSLTTVPFPSYASIVYILSFRAETSNASRPFYVGESGRGLRRLGDYQTAPFAAQTDFKVGIAVKTFFALGYQISVHYHGSQNRRNDESNWIARLEQQGFRLLNRLPGYNYRTADRKVEEDRIIAFVHALHHAIKPEAGDA